MMKIFILVSILFCVLPTLATEVLLLGGGGEGRKNDTIFDESLSRLARVKGDVNLSINSSFNGGHSATENIISKELQVPNRPFTEKNYLAMIDEYVAKINSGQIKPGENLMVIINTHGAEKTPANKTHAISMSGDEAISDYNQLRGNDLSSADKLEALANAAKARGVRLAILDFSCHSGNSLPLANENTCVISSSGPNHFGYTNFAELFFNKMEKGKSLEDIFLQVRQQQTLPSFPMISTSAGRQVNDEYYSKFSPYMNVTDPKGGSIDKLKPYLNSLFEDGNMCKREQDYHALTKQLEDFQKINGALNSRYGSEDLVENLNSLKSLQDSYIKKIQNQGFGVLNQQYQISWGLVRNRKTGKMEPQSEMLSAKDILRYAAGNLATIKQDLNRNMSPAEKRDAMNTYDRYSKIIQKQNEILRQYPQLKDARINLDDLKNDADTIEHKAQKVTELANKVYDARYRALKAQQGQKAEPCRDFVL